MSSTPALNPTVRQNDGNVNFNENMLEDLVFDDKDIRMKSMGSKKQAKTRRKNTIPRQTTMSPIKFAFSKAMGMNLETIPDFLSKRNPAFQSKLSSIRPSTIEWGELRKIALLMYQIMSLEMLKSLWLVYRKAGQGDLPLSTTTLLTSNQQLNRKMWPLEVQSYAKLSHYQQDNNSNIEDRCLTFVNEVLHELDQQSIVYRQKLAMKTSPLTGYTCSLGCVIEKFVQQGLSSKRLEMDRHMALIQYDYNDRLFKCAFLSQHPRENQIQRMKRLCQLKSEQEMTKQEVNFLKIQIPKYLTTRPFENQSLVHSSLINRIRHPMVREELSTQLKETAEETQMKMTTLYMKYAEIQMNQSQTQFDMEMKQWWEIEKTLPLKQQLTSLMQKLIDQRLANITDRIECMYKFKIQLYHLPSNH